VGIAGHRDGFFRGLKDIHEGDTIDLITQTGSRRYIVDEILIVSPDDAWVLRPRPAASLTLVTCYPFYFVGNAPQRFIVHASIADTGQPANGEEQSSSAGKGGYQDRK
jgi:sortase A